MTMPTPDKTWQFAINNVKPALPGGYTYDYRTVMLAIKKSLTSFTNNPWTVSGSSNSLTAGMDGVDRWPAYLQGTDTNATCDTSAGKNVLRIRTVQNIFYQFSVTSGASTAKTQIVADLNNATTGFPSIGAIATLVASIDGYNRLTINDSSTNAYIEIDSTANGSTLNTPVVFSSSGVRTIDNLVWQLTGVARSWIVLKQTNIFSTFEICLDCYTNSVGNVAYAGVYVGLSGYGTTYGGTNGSTTTKPTAATEKTLIAPYNYFCNGIGNAAFGSVMHVMQSTDGQCTRIILMYNGDPTTFYLFDKPKNPVAGWTNPCIYFAYASTGSRLPLNTWNNGANVNAVIGGITTTTVVANATAQSSFFGKSCVTSWACE
jgi:hypothetical protein